MTTLPPSVVPFVLPAVSLAACAAAAGLCFVLTRRVSPRPWLWSILAIVVYLAGVRAVLSLVYGDLPSEDAAARAYDHGHISYNEYEFARDQDHHARYVAFGVAFLLAVLTGVARRWPTATAPVDVEPERQLAGKTCAVCGERIVAAQDGVIQKKTGRVVHKTCRARRKKSRAEAPD